MNFITLDNEYIGDFLEHVAEHIGLELLSWSAVVDQEDGQIVVNSDDFVSLTIQAVGSLTVKESEEGEGK